MMKCVCASKCLNQNSRTETIWVNPNKLLSLIDPGTKWRFYSKNEIKEEEWATQDALKTSLDSLKSLCHQRRGGIGLIFAVCMCVWEIQLSDSPHVSEGWLALAWPAVALKASSVPGLGWLGHQSCGALSVGKNNMKWTPFCGAWGVTQIIGQHSLCFLLPSDVFKCLCCIFHNFNSFLFFSLSSFSFFFSLLHNSDYSFVPVSPLLSLTLSLFLWTFLS